MDITEIIFVFYQNTINNGIFNFFVCKSTVDKFSLLSFIDIY